MFQRSEVTGVYVIDNKMRHAAGWAFAGAALAYIGLIHGAQLGWAVSPLTALGYGAASRAQRKPRADGV